MNKPNTRQLLVDTFRSLGVEFNVEEEVKGKPFVVSYKEEVFLFYANDDSVVLDIWDYQWYSVNAFDVEAISKVQKAINEINKFSAAKLVYNETDEDSIAVSSKRTTAFFDQMKGLAPYLRMELDGMLMLHHELGKQLGIVTPEKERIEDE